MKNVDQSLRLIYCRAIQPDDIHGNEALVPLNVGLPRGILTCFNHQRKHCMLTYSQNYEDIILDRFFRHKEAGFYIDVGAHDPEDISVTRKFYERGWRGINIEPLPVSVEKFRKTRPEDVNLQLAVAAKKGKRVFYQLEGVSSSSSEAVQPFPLSTRRLPCRRANDSVLR